MVINNGGHLCGLVEIIEGVFLSLNNNSILNVRGNVQAYKNILFLCLVFKRKEKNKE